MKVTDLAKYLNDEEAAMDLIESIRWPDGRKCPFCQNHQSFRLNVQGVKRRRYKCSYCRKQFTVSVGTIFEDSHIPFGKWLYAIYQMCIAKKGVSAKQLERELGLSYKSAWFMCHRIRYAMSKSPFDGKLSGIVEMDETYVGHKVPGRKGKDTAKACVVSLVQRDGAARSFVVSSATHAAMKRLAEENVHPDTNMMTDSFVSYRGFAKEFGGHGTVNHRKGEYARGIVHINFAESYFSLLKRGVFGTFHHISKEHLPLYLNEFDFRWSNRKTDQGEIVRKAISGFEGKRLMYQGPSRAA